MKRLKTLMAAFTIAPGAAQPAETKRRYADLVIGGLLVVLAIGGFAM